MSEIFDLKTSFLLGNYQSAINHGKKIDSSDEIVRIERDIYVYRSYIEQNNYNVVINGIKDNAPYPLLAIRLLAHYLKGGDKDKIFSTLNEWLSDPEIGEDYMVQYIAALIYFHDRNYEQALQYLFDNKLLEAKALLIQLLLTIRRPDLAEKELSLMLKVNEFSIPTLLSSAWVNLYLGGEKCREALLTFQELGKKYGSSPRILNGIAVCNIHMMNYQEAEDALLESLEKYPNITETIINLIVVSNHQGKRDEAEQYMSQLRSIAPNHPWLSQLNEHEEFFDKCVERFASGNDE